MHGCEDAFTNDPIQEGTHAIVYIVEIDFLGGGLLSRETRPQQILIFPNDLKALGRLRARVIVPSVLQALGFLTFTQQLARPELIGI